MWKVLLQMKTCKEKKKKNVKSNKGWNKATARASQEINTLTVASIGGEEAVLEEF